MPRPDARLPCPCESGSAYERCCGPLHGGIAASSAVALMRSRYAAYVLQLDEYLLLTWHASTRPARMDLVAEGAATRWLGLRIVEHHENGVEGTAEVEFIARYRIGGGRAERLHERSHFVREAQSWLYVAGVMK